MARGKRESSQCSAARSSYHRFGSQRRSTPLGSAWSTCQIAHFRDIYITLTCDSGEGYFCITRRGLAIHASPLVQTVAQALSAARVGLRSHMSVLRFHGSLLCVVVVAPAVVVLLPPQTSRDLQARHFRSASCENEVWNPPSHSAALKHHRHAMLPRTLGIVVDGVDIVDAGEARCFRIMCG